MANREALRELQHRLSSRMQAARTEARVKSWLAVECAGQGLLFPLHEAGEIFSVGSVLPVPHTQAWFAGVANLRGGLHAVVISAAYVAPRNSDSMIRISNPSPMGRGSIELAGFPTMAIEGQSFKPRNLIVK